MEWCDVGKWMCVCFAVVVKCKTEYINGRKVSSSGLSIRITHIPPVHFMTFLVYDFCCCYSCFRCFYHFNQKCNLITYSFSLFDFNGHSLYAHYSLSAFNDWKENFINVTWDIKMYFNARLCSLPLSLCVSLFICIFSSLAEHVWTT